MVDVRNSSPLLYLPFDKLMQQALQDSGVARPAPTVVPEPAPVPEDAAAARICARAIATRGERHREADEQNRCSRHRAGARGRCCAGQHVYRRSAPVRDRVPAGRDRARRHPARALLQAAAAAKRRISGQPHPDDRHAAGRSRANVGEEKPVDRFVRASGGSSSRARFASAFRAASGRPKSAFRRWCATR